MNRESQLDQLKKMTTVVADTGDFESIQKYRPTDATTNPSLILQAVTKEGDPYKHLIEDAVRFGHREGKSKRQKITYMMEKLFVNFGIEILKVVPGRVSTEVDARLSFDVAGSIKKAHRFIALYKDAGISKDRILIKLASTWEGAKACRVLEQEGIHCNMTLMFSLPQAVECARAGATLISPFVGRILDWYKQAMGVASYPPHKDPGVLSVRKIYNYYKKHGYPTQIMGASFRNKEQILQLAGCDLLTIAPKFLEQLSQEFLPVDKKLDPSATKSLRIPKLALTEKGFRWRLNENEMAHHELAKGIRHFGADSKKLEKFVEKNFT